MAFKINLFQTWISQLHLVARKMSKKTIRFFCWPPWQMIIPLVLAVLTAIGTIIESRYNDAQAATKWVYHTWWMYLVLGQLCLTLIAVMIDRWPWKKRHGPFLAAHIGILTLLLGAWITQQYGLDGSMRFEIGAKNRLVTVPETELKIWSSFDGDRYTEVLAQKVDFFSRPPQKYPFQIPLAEGPLSVIEFAPYVFASRQIVASASERAGSAIRFQLSNDRANINDWLLQTKKDQDVTNQFGLAHVTLGKAPLSGKGENELYLTPEMGAKNGAELKYKLFFKDGMRQPKQGRLKEGDSFDTGWMGLQFRVLRYFPKAEETYDFKKSEKLTPLTTSAIKINYMGKDHWLQVNDVLKLFTQEAVYFITYGNRRIDLGFDLLLKKFEVGRYQGTTRAASYQSLVATEDGAETLISMNEPLKHQGLTFYQASFQDGPQGQPIASILSVNYDPGRWLKYLGSLILTLGVVWLFYNKRRAARAAAPKNGAI